MKRGIAVKQKLSPKWVLANLEEVIASVAIALMLIICSCNVFARYVLHNAISWSDEVCVCLLSWTTFVGAAAAYKRNLHYGMDFLIDHVPAGGKRALRIFITLCITGASIFLAWYSLQLTLKAVKVMPYSRLSYKWLDSAAVIGFTSMALHGLYYLIQAFAQPQKFEARFSPAGQEEATEE